MGSSPCASDRPRGTHQFLRPRQRIIWPLDTFRAFRALGFNWIASVIAFVGLHAALSYVTVDGSLPDPRFRIYVHNVHKIQHGSDSGAHKYDNEGRLIPQKWVHGPRSTWLESRRTHLFRYRLEDFFTKYSSAPGKDSLTKDDISNGLRGQRLLADLFGRFAAYAECKPCTLFVHNPGLDCLILIDLLYPRDGTVLDGRAQGWEAEEGGRAALVEGRLFYEIAEREGGGSEYEGRVNVKTASH